MGYSLWCRKELDTTEHTPYSLYFLHPQYDFFHCYKSLYYPSFLLLPNILPYDSNLHFDSLYKSAIVEVGLGLEG